MWFGFRVKTLTAEMTIHFELLVKTNCSFKDLVKKFKLLILKHNFCCFFLIILYIFYCNIPLYTYKLQHFGKSNRGLMAVEGSQRINLSITE